MHKYNMRRLLKDQAIFLMLGAVVAAYILFVFRKRPVFSIVLALLVILCSMYSSRRIVLLGIDKIIGKKTAVACFKENVDRQELQFIKRTYCYIWELVDENGSTLRLMIPEATTKDSIMQPKKDRKLRIEYYKMSRLLISWEILD